LQTSRPWGTNFWPKFEIFTVFGAVFPHFCPDKRKIWHGGADRAKFHVYRGNMSPLRGEKPIFGRLSKNNTGMAALRASLPVTRNQYASPPEGNAIPAGPLSYFLSDFYKIRHGENVPGPCLAPNFTVVALKNVVLQPPK